MIGNMELLAYEKCQCLSRIQTPTLFTSFNQFQTDATTATEVGIQNTAIKLLTRKKLFYFEETRLNYISNKGLITLGSKFNYYSQLRVVKS